MYWNIQHTFCKVSWYFAFVLHYVMCVFKLKVSLHVLSTFFFITYAKLAAVFLCAFYLTDYEVFFSIWITYSTTNNSVNYKKKKIPLREYNVGVRREWWFWGIFFKLYFNPFFVVWLKCHVLRLYVSRYFIMYADMFLLEMYSLAL